MASQQPIFIVGVHRSGTTLLRYMLSSSPRIYIPPESDFIPRFFLNKAQAPLTQKQVANMLAIIFGQYRFVKEWRGEQPESGEFYQQMGEPTAAAFLETLFQMYARQYGAARWGDKTPIYASYIDLLHELFPEARFLHVIRDGRDVAMSMLDVWGQNEFHVDLYFAACNWVRRIEHVQESAKRIRPDLLQELRYEDLVEAPERVLQTVCLFLDEPFVADMVQPHKLGRRMIRPNSFHAPIRHPPSSSRVGRWKQEMSASDQRLFQQVAGELLEKLGYELTDLGPMTPRERTRLYALASKYLILQGGRRILQMAGMMPPI